MLLLLQRLARRHRLSSRLLQRLSRRLIRLSCRLLQRLARRLWFRLSRLLHRLARRLFRLSARQRLWLGGSGSGFPGCCSGWLWRLPRQVGNRVRCCCCCC
jgi:hypothetical protein